MFGLKATAILLITAIFNPLCCCLDLFGLETDVARQTPAAMHVCCTSNETGPIRASGHTQTDCPHELEKQSQINETADSHAGVAKAHLPSLGTLCTFELPLRELEHEASRAGHADVAPLLPRSLLSQKYCVYLL